MDDSWLQQHRGETVVVKFGGNAMVDDGLGRAFAEDMVTLLRAGLRPVVVHGGGPQISAELARQGITSEFRGGYRYTNTAAINVVRSVLTGQVSRQLAGLINERGRLAEVLSGDDSGLFRARRRGVMVDGELVDLGFVGDVVDVDPRPVLDLLDAGTIPVVSSIAPDSDAPGKSLNVNADSAAGALAVALGAAALIILTDVAGLYRDWPHRDSLVSLIDAAELETLLPALESGMIPKMTACLEAVRGGVGQAIIIDGRVEHAIVREPFGTSGTTVVLDGTKAGVVSGTSAAEWRDRYNEAMVGVYSPPLAVLTRGEGCHVWDVDGKRYLDFLAGIAVNALGHAHPVLVAAVSRQAATLLHVSNYFATQPQIELAERLRRISGAGAAGRVFFGNSGTEAIEAAFKLARLNRGDGSRTRILSLTNSFHGRTMGALALTGQPALSAAFEPLPGGVEHIDSTIEALEAAIDDTVAALVVEPIKGEAGVVDLPDGFLIRARQLTQRHGALLILDEIQTGIARTGSWFAFQQFGITPDAIALAKGIAGGVPMGALITFGSASSLFTRGQHGSTFGGNPLASAAANAVLQEIESAGLIENARARGEQLREFIVGLGSPLITEIRGRGLLIGLGLREPVAKSIVAAALELGLIINAPNASSIRIAPPLIVGDAELAEFREMFSTALEAR